MKKQCLYSLLGVVLFLSCYSSAKDIVLTSLDWPPFTSPSIGGGGMTSIIVKQAFEREGYNLKIEFEPWETAVSRAMNDSEVAGYFPEYYSSDLEKRCVFSDAIGTSMVVFAHRAEEEKPSATLKDLASSKVGVVSGYVNEENFDHAVAQKKIPVLESVDDVQNIKNLLGHKVDLAVIDKRVLSYWVSNDKDLKPRKGEVKYNMGGLKLHGLYVCFTGADAEENAAVLARGLRALDPMGFGLQNDPMYKDKM
ncbi:substrate-binding periplasmic protein [Gynuella sp.]|uniref:substrate-binding periplasmic protein n=1 Tax=Gynuella sp. TaxID=2969146 RepID=UPI003D13821C